MKITAKQAAFADAVVAGKTGSDAYRESYATRCSNKVVSVKAAELMANPKVKARIAELQAELKKASILDKQKSLELLSEIANGKGEEKSRDRIAAVKQISRMQGFDAPTQIEAKLEGSLLDQIRRGKS